MHRMYLPAEADEDHNPYAKNTKSVHSKYLFQYLNSNVFERECINNSNGIAQLNLSSKWVESYQIPLPPLPDQIRIATVLTRAEKLIAKRKESIAALDEFLKSSFLEMFGDPVRNEKRWARIPLSEILLKIESGHSPVCLDRSAKPGEWGVLKLGAVTKCIFISSENKALPDTEKPNPNIEIKAGDDLFSRKNTYELVAACVYVWETPPMLMMSD